MISGTLSNAGTIGHKAAFLPYATKNKQDVHVAGQL